MVENAAYPPETLRELNYLQRHARVWMSAVLVLNDLFSLTLAFVLAYFLRIWLLGGGVPLYQYIELYPALFVLLIIYAGRGLYPTVGLNPIDELRYLVSATSMFFLVLVSLTFLLHVTVQYSRLIFGFAWLLSLVLVQVNRWLVRILARKLKIWGEPVAIVGTGSEGKYIYNYLGNSIRLGIWPMMMIDGHAAPDNTVSASLKKLGIRTAVLVVPEISEELFTEIMNGQLFGFRHLILISSLGWAGSLGIIPHDLEGILGLEMRQNLLNPWFQFLKRFQDLFLVCIGGILIFPFLLVIALLIRLDSPGPVIYKQVRVGQHGRKFIMWKFRTMISSADEKLADYLASNLELKAEWDATQKIKNDPRITRVGKILRQLSLDELPQLINVLQGKMSLVGPRPYFHEQQELYGKNSLLYQKVRPGMTGMWQVSGRNHTTFQERVRLDEYYLRNWSIWLDVYILLRTIWVILTRHGAY